MHQHATQAARIRIQFVHLFAFEMARTVRALMATFTDQKKIASWKKIALHRHVSWSE